MCSITWGEREDGLCEIIDVIYTQEPMEITENSVANAYIKFNVNQAEIERNNGGRGFARNVREKIQGKVATVVNDFHQSANKEARIYSNSSWIERNVLFPHDWRQRFPKYYEAMTTYQAQGKNKHDDAPDATTGIAETMTQRQIKVQLFKGGL